MTLQSRNLLIGAGLIAGLAVCGGALVKAQQSAEPVHAASAAPPEPAAEEAPPPAAALSGGIVVPPSPPAEAADVEPAPEAGPAASAAPEKPAEPLKRPRYTSAVLQVVDKVTAQTLRFEAQVNRPVRYKSLIFTVRACETTAPDEAFNDAAAHVEVDSQPIPQEGGRPPAPRQVFRGWMFANSPGLDLFQHPVYDAWLIACKTEAPSA